VWSYPRRSYIFHVSSKSVKGFWSPWGRNLPIPITLAIGFYNSLHYRASRDTRLAIYFSNQKNHCISSFNCSCPLHSLCFSGVSRKQFVPPHGSIATRGSFKKNATPHRFMVHVPAPHTAKMAVLRGCGRGGHHLPQWGTVWCSDSKSFWNSRCKFLLSGTLLARKLTLTKVQNTTNFHFRLFCVHPARGDTKNRDS